MSTDDLADAVRWCRMVGARVEFGTSEVTVYWDRWMGRDPWFATGLTFIEAVERARVDSQG